MAACESVIPGGDAAQGVEAQALSHCSLASEYDLELGAYSNQMHLPEAAPDTAGGQLMRELDRLVQYREAGHLSDQEFQTAKLKLLG